MEGLRIAHPKLSGPQENLYPQPEQERFTFSILEKVDTDLGQPVQILPIETTLDMLVQDARSKHIKIKKLLLQAIEPMEDILVNDYKASSKEKQKSINKFLKKIKDINKQLLHENIHLLPKPARKVDDRKSAYIYKMQLLHAVRNMFARGDVKDIGHNFWVEDKNGHRIDQKIVDSWSQQQVDFVRAKGDLNIVYEETNVAIEIIDRIIDEAGLSSMLGADVQQHLQDVKTLRRHGVPFLNGNDVWYNFVKAERDIDQLLNNERDKANVKALEKRYPGMWQKFMNSHHDVQHSLGCLSSIFEEAKRALSRTYKRSTTSSKN